jgi:hypothetical protein
MKTLPGIPEVTEEMLFPENDQQMASQVVTHETAPPDITMSAISTNIVLQKCTFHNS